MLLVRSPKASLIQNKMSVSIIAKLRPIKLRKRVMGIKSKSLQTRGDQKKGLSRTFISIQT